MSKYLRRSNFFRICISVMVLLLLANGTTHALSQQDSNSIYNDTVWYQPDAVSGCTVSLSTNLNGNDNEEKAYNFFVGKGLTPEQSAGIVGNFKWESGVDPTKDNGGGDSQAPIGDKAWGIAQWLGGRRDNLLSYASQHNLTASDLGTQLNFSWYEFSGSLSNALDDLKKQTSVQGATLSVFVFYEGANDSTGPSRVGLAQQVLNEVGGSSAAGTVATSSNPSGGCSPTGPGQNTAYIDGFTIYSQYDPSWASKPYGDTTIAAAGCGPSAMAMIITALTGASVTPDITAAYADSQNLYVSGEGSSWSIAKVLAAHWELKSYLIGASISKISASLQAGDLVIASGQGALPFTSAGHFIVIRAVASDGKWKIGDSGHDDTSSQEWDPQQLITEMNDGSVYAISK